MTLLKYLLYAVLPLLVFFASGIDAQSPEEIAVSISYSGDTSIEESVVLSRQDDDVTGEISYTLGNPKINFTISLSRALTAGEFVNVPLNVRNINLDDITVFASDGRTTQTIALDTSANTGVTLTGTNTLRPNVAFRGAGAQTAGLQITVNNDNVLENDETMVLTITENFSTTTTLSAVRDSSSVSPAITIIDDEYNIRFVRPMGFYTVRENAGSMEAPITIARGLAGNGGLLRETGMRFRYTGLRAALVEDFTPAFSTSATPSFVRLPAGATEYTLAVPIINDTEPEDNEIFRIYIDRPLRPDGQPPRQVDVVIREDGDFIHASITADQEQIDEGDIAQFSLLVTTLSRDHTIPSTIELRVSDFPGSDFIAQAFEEQRHTVELDFLPEFQRMTDGGVIYYTTATATFSVPTVDNNLDDRENRIRAEIVPSSEYEIAISPATVMVRDNDPRASIVSARAVHKGEDIVLAITFNVPATNDITIPIDITEIEETAGKDFISRSQEGRKMITVPAGATRIEYSIPTRNLDPGNRAVAGRVTASLVSLPDNLYVVGSPALASIDIVDTVCGHAADADADDDGLIEICDLEDLDAMRYQLDGSGYRASSTAPLFNAGCDDDGDQGGICRGYELTRNLDFEDTGSYISGSINRAWSEGLGWQPIGEALEAFSGYFEANGYEIINLYINRPVDNVGLIRNTAPSALINDLTLLQVNIRGKSQLGALVGSNEGIVSNIEILNGSINGIGDDIGGLIGRNKGTVFKNNVTIDTLTGGITELRCRTNLQSTNCADTEKITIVLERGNNVGGLIGNNEGNLADNFASAEVLGGSRVGGLVGFHSGGIFNGNEAVGSVRGDEYIGGLIGYSEGTISGSSVSEITVSGGPYVGGLIGYSEGTISGSSISELTVSGGTYIGGLIGYSEGTISDSSVSELTVSGGTYVGGLVGYSEGTISDSSVSELTVSGGTYVGGLVGAIEAGSILASNASGEVTGEVARVGGLVGSASGNVRISESYASSTVQGSYDVGGLAGSTRRSEIVQSYASGTVTGTAHSVGGLVGNAYSTTLTIAYAVGAVSGDNSADPGVENDVEHVGGLIGKAEEATIVKSYALNPSVQGADKVGGLIGTQFNGTVLNSYTLSPVQGVNRVGGLIGENRGVGCLCLCGRRGECKRH